MRAWQGRSCSSTAVVTVAGDGSIVTDHDRLVDAFLQDGTDDDRAWVRARLRDYPKHALVEPVEVAGSRDCMVSRPIEVAQALLAVSVGEQ